MLSVTLVVWTGDAKRMRANKLFCGGPLWVIYSILVGSVSGALGESIGMVSAALALLRYRRTDKDVTSDQSIKAGEESHEVF
jgi:D-serine dehydratase